MITITSKDRAIKLNALTIKSFTTSSQNERIEITTISSYMEM